MANRSDRDKLSNGSLCFEGHGAFGGNDPDGSPFPFGYISTSPTTVPVFELNVLLHFDKRELKKLALRMAAANDLLAALKNARTFMIPGMNWTDEIGQRLIADTDAAIKKAEG